MLKYLALLYALVPTAALAQQQTPENQALATRLMQEINTGLQCQTSLITAQRELEDLKKKHAEESAPTGGSTSPPPKPPR